MPKFFIIITASLRLCSNVSLHANPYSPISGLISSCQWPPLNKAPYWSEHPWFGVFPCGGKALPTVPFPVIGCLLAPIACETEYKKTKIQILRANSSSLTTCITLSKSLNSSGSRFFACKTGMLLLHSL